MPLSYWWNWSIGLPSTDYQNAGFTLSSTSLVVTNNTTNLFTPAIGSNSPSEEYHCRIQGVATILSPQFSSLSQGWLVFRWSNINGVTLSTSNKIVEFMSDPVTTIFDIRPGSNNVISHLEIWINNTFAGTSISNVSTPKYYVLAIDFILNPTVEIGLSINGEREIFINNGAGSLSPITYLRFSSGATSSNQTFIGDFMLFDNINDLSPASSQDVWSTWLSPTSSTDADNSWTPTAGTDVSITSDRNSASYTQTSTSPDSISFTPESFNSRSTSWTASTIYGLATIAYASADTSQTNTTLTLQDSAPANSINQTLTSTPTFLGVWTYQDSANNPWTQSTVESSSMIYEVA